MSDVILISSSRDDDVMAKFCCSVTVKIISNQKYFEIFDWLNQRFPNQFISTRFNSRKPFKFLFTEDRQLTMFIIKWC